MASIKQLLKSCKPLYNTYRYLVAQRAKHKLEKAENYFAKKSTETMGNIQSLLEKSNRKFYFAFGTLLGIIRELQAVFMFEWHGACLRVMRGRNWWRSACLRF